MRIGSMIDYRLRAGVIVLRAGQLCLIAVFEIHWGSVLRLMSPLRMRMRMRLRLSCYSRIASRERRHRIGLVGRRIYVII